MKTKSLKRRDALAAEVNRTQALNRARSLQYWSKDAAVTAAAWADVEAATKIAAAAWRAERAADAE